MNTSTTWLGIIGALVPSVIALVAAIVSLLNRRQLKTANGTTIGRIASDVSHQIVTGNDKTLGEMVTEVHGAAATDSAPFEKHGTVDMA